ncbi:MAG: glycosyltransferase [Patescibacteria group bacterium]
MAKYAVGCIIPTFQNKGLLKKHLPAVLDSLPDESILTVIEDAGSDDTAAWLIKTFSLRAENIELESTTNAYCADANDLAPDRHVGEIRLGKKQISFQLLQTRHNVRFAKSVNGAMLATSAEYVFLCNNDVSPQRDTITVLLKQILEDLSVFGIGCLEYASEKLEDPSGKNVLWFERGLFQHSRAPDQQSGETAWVSGGSGLFNRSHWLALGGFDPTFYPAYWEDIDISYRAKKHGLKVMFTDQTFVIHQHESTHKTIFDQKSMQRTSWQHARYFTWKHASLGQKLQFLAWQPFWRAQELRTLLAIGFNTQND